MYWEVIVKVFLSNSEGVLNNPSLSPFYGFCWLAVINVVCVNLSYFCSTSTEELLRCEMLIVK